MAILPKKCLTPASSDYRLVWTPYSQGFSSNTVPPRSVPATVGCRAARVTTTPTVSAAFSPLM